MRWALSLLCLALLVIAACEAFSGAVSLSPRGLLKARGGAVIKKSMATAEASSSGGLKRTRVYKKEGFIARFVGGMKAFVKSYFASLINPTFEKELGKGGSSSSSSSSSVVGGGGSAAAALKASAARRKRTGGRRTGSISDLAPEPSSCGA